MEQGSFRDKGYKILGHRNQTDLRRRMCDLFIKSARGRMRWKQSNSRHLNVLSRGSRKMEK
jgi:hypothetical protein